MSIKLLKNDKWEEFEDGNGNTFSLKCKVITIFDYKEIQDKHLSGNELSKIKKIAMDKLNEEQKNEQVSAAVFDVISDDDGDNSFMDLVREVNKKVWIDWKGVLDDDGEPIDFEPRFIEFFSGDLQSDFYKRYMENTLYPKLERFDEVSKNLESTQN